MCVYFNIMEGKYVKRTLWKMAVVAGVVVLLQAGQARAWDDCAQLAQEGPALAHEKGRCEKAGSADMDKDGKVIQGLVQCKDASGKILEESKYVKGVRTSVWFLDSEGRKLSFTLKADEKTHGPARAFDKDGSPLCKMNYDDGILEGPVREYYPEGKLRRSYVFKKGKREGKYLEYDQNGKLMLERKYKSGVDTMEKFYYPDGKVQEHTTRHADGKSYTTRNYWPNGKLQGKASFEIKTRPNCTVNEAVRVGKVYKYAADGSLQEEANYDDIGRLDGKQIHIDEQGKRAESVYDHGVLKAPKASSADGKPEADEKYDNNGSKK